MDKYVVERKIGSGSYGSVFLCKSKKDSCRYVLKRIPTANMNQKEKKAAKQEVALLQSLQHPFIVGYKDSFLDKNDLCIIMTYCGGGDLSSLIKDLKGKKFSEDQIMKWVSQMLLAIEFIHSRRVLHRDLKSQNIFLTEDGDIKLGDFGIARVLDKTLDMAQTSIGTPLYMSPETVSNKPYNFKSDVWSLGCIIYELCALQHPFNAKDLRSLFVKIARGVYAPIPFTYSSKLRNVVAKMLTTDPKKRPDVEEIIQYPFVNRHISVYLSSAFGGNFFPQENKPPKLVDTVEFNNLKIQLENFEVPLMTQEQIQQEKTKKQQEQEKQKEVIPNPEVRDAVAQLKRLEKEQLQVREALEKLRLQKMKKVHDHENINAQRLLNLEKERREKLNKVEENQRQKLLRAEEKRQQQLQLRIENLKLKNRAPPLPSFENRKPDMKKREISSDSDNDVDYPQRRIERDLEKFKIDKKERPNPVEKIIEKPLDKANPLYVLNQFERDLDKALKRDADHKKEVFDGKRQEDNIFNPPQPSNLSHKDRILMMKEQKRKADEQAQHNALMQARQEYYNNRKDARVHLYNLYHKGNNNAAPVVANPQQPVYPPSRILNEEEEEFKVQRPSKYSISSESDEEEDVGDDDDLVIKEYEKNLKATTKMINVIRKSIHEFYGKNIDELKVASSDDESDSPLHAEDDETEDHFDEEEEEDDERSQIGRLQDRVNFLRNQCLKYFGEDSFNKIYRYLKTVNTDMDEKVKLKELQRIIGPSAPSKLQYCNLVDELLFVEKNCE